MLGEKKSISMSYHSNKRIRGATVLTSLEVAGLIAFRMLHHVSSFVSSWIEKCMPSSRDILPHLDSDLFEICKTVWRQLGDLCAQAFPHVRNLIYVLVRSEFWNKDVPRDRAEGCESHEGSRESFAGKKNYDLGPSRPTRYGLFATFKIYLSGDWGVNAVIGRLPCSILGSCAGGNDQSA